MNITEESILHRFIGQSRGFLPFSSPKRLGEVEFPASLRYLRNPLTKSGTDPRRKHLPSNMSSTAIDCLKSYARSEALDAIFVNAQESEKRYHFVNPNSERVIFGE